jgi:hypothetical protein
MTYDVEVDREIGSQELPWEMVSLRKVDGKEFRRVPWSMLRP